MEMKVLDDLRKLISSFPGIVESISYGTPSFKIKDKFLARLHEDGYSLGTKDGF